MVCCFCTTHGHGIFTRDNRKTVIRAGAGMFYGVLPLLASNFAANPNRTITEFDAAGDAHRPSRQLYKRVHWRCESTFDSCLTRQPNTTPRNVTWNGEVDREVAPKPTAKASYLDSHTSYLFDVQPYTAADRRPILHGTNKYGFVSLPRVRSYRALHVSRARSGKCLIYLEPVAWRFE